MTRPAPTYCTYEGLRYEAFQFATLYARDSGRAHAKGFPHPDDFGAPTLGVSSNCWNGYRFEVSIDGGELRVTKVMLMVPLDEPETWPTINGVQGHPWNSREAVWHNQSIPTTYTGPLALYYAPDKAQPTPRVRVDKWPNDFRLDLPTPYRADPSPQMQAGIACYLQNADRVLRVQVDNGQVTAIDDLSEELQRFRDELH